MMIWRLNCNDKKAEKDAKKNHSISGSDDRDCLFADRGDLEIFTVSHTVFDCRV